MILPIVKFPSPLLTKKTLEIKEITKEVYELAFDMQATMYFNRGVGLAAPQVGRSLKLIVIDVNAGDRKPGKPLILLNPIITAHHGTMLSEEGCLSMPGYMVMVNRYANVSVAYMDLSGKNQIVEAHGDLLSRALQHEIDHLDGKLMVDSDRLALSNPEKLSIIKDEKVL